ncbi:Sulfate permease family [Acididesulfobacillus acetoxydans]|uniref:Proton/sulfate cotransporter 2 n=1 Tax=Acididesulfobacillus acetoxydans TaxID=1561005 RepID=A0A8S0WZJ1_9FIRM|nr:SulP family inorganic anion transporter [Acididesulfobacillus acetoxydans]CAA7601981.1 Sulfate permease family [Acididesulfobacillus acetoxydans]CEJ08175.1 Proton/sulfate cotransporter 2 [Acididesulfobacillus acetoxydans]
MSSLTLDKPTFIAKHIPFIETIRKYKRENIRKDIIAALTVAVVAIPQSMAYALIAGVNPVYGLYTAIVSAILGSAFGSSNQLVTGPTNAICLLVAGGMKNYMGLTNAYELLFLMTFLVGIFQILYGVIRLGKLINFISHSVMVGFTAGAGFLIAIGQLSNLFNISIKNSAQMSPMQIFYYIVTHLGQSHIYSLTLGLLTIAIIATCKKINNKLPGALIGVIVPAFFIVTFSLEQRGVKLIGVIPAALPPFKMIQFSAGSVQEVLRAAFAVSIVGLVEAISISKSIASTSRQKIDSNQEFLGQGIANTVGAFFQCLPSSGSFSRSAINYANGAATRLSGILSGVVVAAVLVFFAPFAKYIPQTCLAGVLMVAAYNLVDVQEFKKVVRLGKLKSDSIALWITFIAVILMPNLDYAIYTGIALSILLYLKDTDQASVKILLPARGEESQILEKEIKSVKEKVEVLIVQLEGNLYFGSTADLEERLDSLVGKSRAFILRMKYVSTVDVTSLNALKVFIRTVGDAGGVVLISGVKPELSVMLEKAGIVSEVGPDNIFMSENEIYASSNNALERAKTVLSY